jgi:hypothetical protein
MLGPLQFVFYQKMTDFEEQYMFIEFAFELGKERNRVKLKHLINFPNSKVE